MVGALITKNASHSIFSREERERKGERQEEGGREGERQEEVGEGGRSGRGRKKGEREYGFSLIDQYQWSLQRTAGNKTV